MPRTEFDTTCLSPVVFDFIRSILPDGSTMVEIGSGYMSHRFAEYYEVYSIEDDEKWICRCSLCLPIHYIYAPRKNNFYDEDAIRSGLPEKYDFLLWDGPWLDKIRPEFLKHLHLFNLDIPIVIDDINVKAIREAAKQLAAMLGRELQEKKTENHREFGYIP